MDVSTCKSKGTVCWTKLCNKDLWNGMEECESCDKDILSVVNKLNGWELKIEESHGVTPENGGEEFGVKCEDDSDWKRDLWNSERKQEILFPIELEESLCADTCQEEKYLSSKSRKGRKPKQVGESQRLNRKKNIRVEMMKWTAGVME